LLCTAPLASIFHDRALSDVVSIMMLWTTRIVFWHLVLYLSSTVWKLVLQLSYVLIEVGITDISIALSHPQSHVMQTSVDIWCRAAKLLSHGLCSETLTASGRRWHLSWDVHVLCTATEMWTTILEIILLGCLQELVSHNYSISQLTIGLLMHSLTH